MYNSLEKKNCHDYILFLLYLYDIILGETQDSLIEGLTTPRLCLRSFFLLAFNK